MTKKGVSLPLETIAIAIIILIAIGIIIFFVLKYGNTLGFSFGEQAKQTVNLLPNMTAP